MCLNLLIRYLMCVLTCAQESQRRRSVAGCNNDDVTRSSEGGAIQQAWVLIG